VISQAGAVLSAVTSRIPAAPGRRQRRKWAGNGRAHIEIKGGQQNHPVARHLESALNSLDGVAWAQVNTVACQVVVAFDGDRVDLAGLVDVIEGIEDAHNLSQERFPRERPEHPADQEPIQRQIYAICADIGGLGLGLAGQVAFGRVSRLARRNPLVGEIASLLSLADSTPGLRRGLESRLGKTGADLGLAVGNAVARALLRDHWAS